MSPLCSLAVIPYLPVRFSLLLCHVYFFKNKFIYFIENHRLIQHSPLVYVGVEGISNLILTVFETETKKNQFKETLKEIFQIRRWLGLKAFIYLFLIYSI